MKKPPSKVVSLRGEHRPDVISQLELEEAEQAQVAEWHSAKRAARLSERIKARIQHGATVEAGKLYYDAETELVRSRKQKAGGE